MGGGLAGQWFWIMVAFLYTGRWVALEVESIVGGGDGCG